MTEIIVAVCGLLNGLCNDIQNLRGIFDQLNATINQLVREYNSIKGPIEDIQEEARESASSGCTPSVNRQDYKDFRHQLHHMRRLSVTVHSLATLYANVIMDVITPGFSKVVEISYDDGGEVDMSLVLNYRQSNMSDYLVRAEKSCRMREKEAGKKLALRLAKIDAAYAPKSRKGSSIGRRDKARNRKG